MTKHSKRRAMALKSVSHLYRRKFANATWCIYCGDSATTIDHVFPISVASGINWAAIGPRNMKMFLPVLVIVPCCQNCNVLAGDYNPQSILDKRRHIKAKLRKRYKAIRMWDHDDLDELAPSFRGYVAKSLRGAVKMQARIAWPTPVPEGIMRILRDF